jgi:hypothetical protein
MPSESTPISNWEKIKLIDKKAIAITATGVVLVGMSFYFGSGMGFDHLKIHFSSVTVRSSWQLIAFASLLTIGISLFCKGACDLKRSILSIFPPKFKTVDIHEAAYNSPTIQI